MEDSEDLLISVALRDKLGNSESMKVSLSPSTFFINNLIFV